MSALIIGSGTAAGLPPGVNLRDCGDGEAGEHLLKQPGVAPHNFQYQPTNYLGGERVWPTKQQMGVFMLGPLLHALQDRVRG
jgi:hypothetical protein